MKLMLAMWLISILLVFALYIFAQILVDGQVELWTWAKIGLVIFAILGPLGVVLELVLFAGVFNDIARQNESFWRNALKSEASMGSHKPVLD